MSTNFSLRLAEHLSSRLCHDLITPIGAINTGLELFQENSTEHITETTDILNLILHSAQTASARVSFFRVAFGSSGSTVSLWEARQLIENCFQTPKLSFHWNEPFDADLALDGWGRILLNAVMWMSECAPRGGEIFITPPHSNKATLSITLKANTIILHEGTLEALEGKVSINDLTPRTVGCYLVRCLTDVKKAKLLVRKTESPSELYLEIKEE